jgi:hypothetical protein
MLQRLFVWAIRAYIRGPARSWVYTSLALLGLRTVRRITGRRPVTETLKVKPGQTVTIEQLGVSHRTQIKEEKRERWRRRRAALGLNRTASPADD